MNFKLFNKRQTLDTSNLPVHIAIIMDGNGRWARRRALPRTAGHTAGAAKFKEITRYLNKIGIKYLTVYAFSTENWKRSEKEINSLMKIFREYLKDAKNFKHENVKTKFIGDLDAFPDDIRELIKDAEDGSKDATGLVLNIAMNYGGRDEIVAAVKRLIKDKVEPTEQAISDRLYTGNIPDPDIIIRPSGEYRLSNFLLWQSAYSEFWFSKILWPDFKTSHLDEAIMDFQKRDRRFGSAK